MDKCIFVLSMVLMLILATLVGCAAPMMPAGHALHHACPEQNPNDIVIPITPYPGQTLFPAHLVTPCVEADGGQ